MSRMNRRQFLSMAAANSLSAALLLNGCANIQKKSYKKPNIIVLVTDDQRWDAMGCAGNSIIKTPNMDKLAQDGTLFTNAFITSPVCMASRASIMTGLYEANHRCNFNTGNLSPKLYQQSYPVLLRQNGYHTGFIGKFGFAVTDKTEVRDKYNTTWHDIANIPADSFDKWYGFEGQGEYFPKEFGGKHLTRVMTEQAEDFLNSCPKDKPFCLSVSFKAPHQPLTPDPVYDDLYKDIQIPHPPTMTKEDYERLPEFLKKCWAHTGYYNQLYLNEELYQDSIKKYYRLVAGVDAAIGKIRQKLNEIGQAENTIIILIGDNGEFEGEHQFGGKVLLREESVRVPFIIYDPRVEKKAKGQQRMELTANVDIAPTVLALADVQQPASMQGMNLQPIVEGRKTSWRNDILLENRFRLAKDYQNQQDWGGQYYPLCTAIRTEHWKYIKYTEPEIYEELFDLKTDPGETKNLAYDKNYLKMKDKLSFNLATMKQKLSR